ncbi:MAG: hypothetical protein OEW64_13730 [Gammaproteobacteria bacterium]|nr:hypothetical protein [Gammaproteobacteria bacterium]MDH5322145.1 hypothetical protein [Gammaproteobacteria bacterium]
MKTCAAFAATVLVLYACASGEVLISKPATVPAGLDLSGDWVMVSSTGFSQRESRELAVSVFLEMGTSLKVTQTASGLFFSFDRSVVEEYRFGEHREVAVGAIAASRVSGWEGDTYVIETLDKDGAKLVESWRLQQKGSVLQRNMVIWEGGDKQLSLEQHFERV